MPITENVVRYIRRIASPTLTGQAADVAELIADASTDTLKFNSGGTKEVMDLSNTQTVTGTKVFSGTTSVRGDVSVTSEAAITVTAAETGKTYIATRSSLTQVFTLPAAATAGLRYTFICGHADGEIRVGVATGDNILGKIHAAEDGTALVTTVSTGLLLNTTSGNVAGDSVTLVSDGVTTWYMAAIIGAWSAA